MEESPKPPKQEKDAKFMALGLRYTAVVTEFVIVLGLMGYAGKKADEKFGSDPWGILVGLLVGLGFGLFVMLRQLEKLNR